ncbi:MAG: hypothetical protein KUA43_18285 [Hoeflea sp.]|uniref:hypothetical protein n=1 Tax=Hoeflea sp. TaxID=1940281 RepID=UPI001DB0DBD5|nr:hypothetical protein [Hoeflea sp.]MBU4529225.1 hypothetical protein [Alphaproteobacteria bacterium]MBU4543629.1 hypothetical protein [Alphaproteobacteria bacterium]MBU4549255.1 hypothetical protein [Alphaproteobacteria bacterium]MBV1725388.1 hypothetical protein [Hoeflea sp.]MBV1785351.1 hypothetical protein [Hoeflea sp.]
MPTPKDPTKVRQGQLGKQVLVILVVSLTLALVAGWVLWGVFANDEGTIPQAFSVPSEQPAMSEPSTPPVLSASSGSD